MGSVDSSDPSAVSEKCSGLRPRGGADRCIIRDLPVPIASRWNVAVAGALRLQGWAMKITGMPKPAQSSLTNAAERRRALIAAPTIAIERTFG